MPIIEEIKGKKRLIEAKEINIENFINKKEMEILKLLLKKNLSAKDICKSLSLHEQTVYYYLKKLERKGLIEVKEKIYERGFEKRIYQISSKAFYFILKQEFEKKEYIDDQSIINFLYPFIENGRFNSLVIIGSPEPHGIERARSKDAYYAFDIAFVLGSFLYNFEKNVVKLDTEIKEKDLDNNLIIVGGPIVNNLCYKINQRMPVVFLSKEKCFFSKKTNKKYYDDEIGVIIKTKNPFSKNKYILVIEGKRYIGTKACVIAFTTYLNELAKKINEKSYTIVKGYDLDSDGIVDDIEFIE